MNRGRKQADRRTGAARPCELPAGSRLPDLMAAPDYQDTFEIRSPRADQSIIETYLAIFGRTPALVKTLMQLRNWLVAPFGVSGPTWRAMSQPADPARKYAVGETIRGWKIIDLSDDEILAGMDDTHLNFIVSVRRDRRPEEQARVTLSTAVVINNSIGRVYLAVILPFHRIIVARLMSSAAHAGRL